MTCAIWLGSQSLDRFAHNEHEAQISIDNIMTVIPCSRFTSMAAIMETLCEPSSLILPGVDTLVSTFSRPNTVAMLLPSLFQVSAFVDWASPIRRSQSAVNSQYSLPDECSLPDAPINCSVDTRPKLLDSNLHRPSKQPSPPPPSRSQGPALCLSPPARLPDQPSVAQDPAMKHQRNPCADPL